MFFNLQSAVQQYEQMWRKPHAVTAL